MIQLTPYGSAVFLAYEEYTKLYGNKVLRKQLILSKSILFDKFLNKCENNNIKYSEFEFNRREQQRIERYQEEIQKRTFVINYLKEKYSDKDYYLKYQKDNKWNLSLRFHNDESKQCEYLSEDKRHCNLKHKSSCYTCCFVCYSPELCEYSNCKLLIKEGDLL